MLLKISNFVLLCVFIICAFILVHIRYQLRIYHEQLAQLQAAATALDKQYARLEIEIGTYSSGIVLANLAHEKFDFIAPDAAHIIKLSN
jgi:cell division protein FtsL